MPAFTDLPRRPLSGTDVPTRPDFSNLFDTASPPPPTAPTSGFNRPGGGPGPFSRPFGKGSFGGKGRGGGKGKGNGGRGKGKGGPPKDSGKDPDAPPMNEDILAPELRVVRPVPGGKDEKLGILSREEALRIAQDEEVDLVLINAEATPPVAKLVNYSKLRYAAEKKKKENMKRGRTKEAKELKMSHKIGQHDYDVRLRAARKFLLGGHHVKVTMEFKGRENQFVEIGRGVMKRFETDLAECSKADAVPQKLGTKLILTLSPAGEALKEMEKQKTMLKSKKEGDKAADEGSDLEEDDDVDEDDLDLAELELEDEGEAEDGEAAVVAVAKGPDPRPAG